MKAGVSGDCEREAAAVADLGQKMACRNYQLEDNYRAIFVEVLNAYLKAEPGWSQTDGFSLSSSNLSGYFTGGDIQFTAGNAKVTLSILVRSPRLFYFILPPYR